MVSYYRYLPFLRFEVLFSLHTMLSHQYHHVTSVPRRIPFGGTLSLIAEREEAEATQRLQSVVFTVTLRHIYTQNIINKK